WRPSRARTNSPVIRLVLFTHSNTAAYCARYHLLTPRKGARKIRTPVQIPSMVLQCASGLAKRLRQYTLSRQTPMRFAALVGSRRVAAAIRGAGPSRRGARSGVAWASRPLGSAVGPLHPRGPYAPGLLRPRGRHAHLPGPGDARRDAGPQ